MNRFKTFALKGLTMTMSLALLAGCGPSIAIEGTETNTNTNTSTTEQTPADSTQGSATTNTPAESGSLDFAEGTVLRMATGYNNKKTGLSFDAETAGEGITLADGVTYNAGDLKPTWVAIEKKLGVKFEDKYQGNSASAEFDYWKERLSEVDMVSGTAALLSQNGEAGSLVNIADYLDKMPHFKAYLDANPIVRLSIVGNTATGAIYFSPYFDGVNDIERMPLMRIDWVEKLLDGEGEFTADASKNLATAVYEPYMPTSGKVEVDVVSADGSKAEKVTKDYDTAGNIVKNMNDAGSLDGVAAVNMLRKYIDEAYDGYYGTKRSDLYVGQNAAWDADELVALLRCVVANPQTLNGTDSIQGLFTREDDNNQRRVDMFRFAGTLFGVRGLESRQDYLYVGNDGNLHDARQEADTYKAMEYMHAMVAEGLISKAFVDGSSESSSTYLENDLGFMHYDYNQTQTILNETKLQKEDGEKYMAVMVPVARWYDGTNADGVYMHFTESWRSVKTDGWGISKAGVGSDENKLNAALALIDFAYTDEGLILLTYGPDDFIKMEGGKYVTFDFNGTQQPVIADATHDELWELTSGNYTNFARQYLGSTLSFVKNQAFEYQCTTEIGQEGAGHISNAIALGVIKHPELDLASNSWYTSVPTVLPTTTVENDQIAGYTELNEKFNQQKGGNNILCDLIINGYTDATMKDAESSADNVKSAWKGAQYLSLKQDAWQRDQDYYKSLK
jgi:putative aldouronate transport system substrate-binding protein